MRKPTTSSVGTFLGALALAVAILGYGHSLWGHGNAYAPLLLAMGYGLLVVSVAVMLWEHLVKRPTWPEFRSPITFRREAGLADPQLETSQAGLKDDREIEGLKHELRKARLATMEKQGEVFHLQRTLDETTKPPSPLPIVVLDKDLVIALKTYGIQAYRLLLDTSDEMMASLSDETGLINFMPRLYSEGLGFELRQAVEALERRVEETESAEPFTPIWATFHWSYCQNLTHWVGTLVYFLGLSDANRRRLAQWRPLHDKYIERVRELGNAPKGKSIKETFVRNEYQVTIYYARLVAALDNPVSSQDPDTSGLPN